MNSISTRDSVGRTIYVVFLLHISDMKFGFFCQERIEKLEKVKQYFMETKTNQLLTATMGREGTMRIVSAPRTCSLTTPATRTRDEGGALISRQRGAQGRLATRSEVRGRCQGAQAAPRAPVLIAKL